jgi:MFS family permease
MSSIALEKIAAGLSYYEYLSIFTANSIATAVAALVGAFFPRRIGNTRFLQVWMTVNAAATFIPLMIETASFLSTLSVALLWGATLGFGMPASMEYLTENTIVENRGRASAFTFFTTFAGIFILGAILEPSAYSMQIIVLGTLRFVGLAIFVLLGSGEVLSTRKVPSYMNVVREKPFLLYFSAWLMFSLVNYLSAPILYRHFGEGFVGSYATIEAIITAVFALVGGFLCDAVGRKLVVISGFVMLGMGYAVLGVFPTSLVGWYFYTVVDGIAWGTLGVVFFMTLWGDLAYEKSSKRYFAIGALPLLFSNLLQKLVGPDLAASVPVTAVFSLASFFLFLAVLPLMYAPETLPEKGIKERELKGYVEKAKKTKEKYT